MDCGVALGGGSRRRMKIEPRQQRSKIDQLCSVQSERVDRCTACGSQPNDQRSVLAPFEMIRPPLAARIEETLRPSCQRVGCFDFLAFESIAVGTGESEIGQPGFSTARFGIDVVGNEEAGRVTKRAAAVFTQSVGPFLCGFTQSRSDSFIWHKRGD